MLKPKSPMPPVSFLFRHPAYLIACGFGSGLSPFASGTVGTLFAWLSYPLLRHYFVDDFWFGGFLVVMFALGIPVCHLTGNRLGVADHGAIVWDEIVPFWMVLLLTPATVLWQFAAFLGFRFYDIVKPPPARYFDQKMKNGFGVMMDDLVAAAYTVLTLALFKFLLDQFF
ncbi:MAG: phosphatidylglycerophosphatase A [Zoogloeaceae bacterium]|jgi:phosphatidylglycerophosphatase A|nr:phosphatidylglycerophosphatase A [Zoogloeaceae bacterium]